jgi:hypothetical protein
MHQQTHKKLLLLKGSKIWGRDIEKVITCKLYAVKIAGVSDSSTSLPRTSSSMKSAWI